MTQRGRMLIPWKPAWLGGKTGNRQNQHEKYGNPVTLFKIKADSLHKASENCQLRFNRSFMNILVDRLAQATSELATVY